MDRIAERVGAAKRPDDVAVLSIHWGGNWGYGIPQEQQTFAHRLIDSGAVEVIQGHSSHHPKAIEVYRDKPILYGCGDFLNDYEGIAGHEEFRSELVLMYFVAIDSSTRKLLRLLMTPFEIRRFRLQRATHHDATWLDDTPNRESKGLGTQVILNADNASYSNGGECNESW